MLTATPGQPALSTHQKCADLELEVCVGTPDQAAQDAASASTDRAEQQQAKICLAALAASLLYISITRGKPV
jgi:hypothetical protein